VYERVRQPVDHHVEAGRVLQGGLHDDARLAPVEREQVVYEQERVAGAGVAAQHDDRPGQPRAELLGGGRGLLDLYAQPEDAQGDPEQHAQEPPDQRVVAVHRRLGVQAPAEPAGDPQAEAGHQCGRLEHEPGEPEPEQPGRPTPAVARRHGQRGQQQQG
jgi:hypothetical protein